MPRPSITFVSGREVHYTRNKVIVQSLGSKFELKVAPTRSRRIFKNTILGTLYLLSQSRTDLYFAGFLGQPLAVSLSILKRPYILDSLVSVYETLCEDREVFRKTSVYAKLSYWLDFFALSRAKLVVTDTWSNALFFSSRFGIEAEKFAVVYIGCDEKIFTPQSKFRPNNDSEIVVFTYNSFLPLHGNEVIIEAARMLESDSKIKFVIGGSGPKIDAIKKDMRNRNQKNINFVGWISYDKLPEFIEKADICLGGHFSLISKAGRSLSTKTFQFMAMQKPVIVGNGEAAAELLQHEVNAYIVPRGNPEALAAAIKELASDPPLRRRLGVGAYELYKEKFSTHRISEMLEKAILKACESA